MVLLGASAGIAQTFTSTDGILSPALQRGVQASSRAFSAVDSVNLYNGHLNVSIPLVAVGGRGTAGYTMVLPIDTAFAVANTSGTMAAVAAPGPAVFPYSPGSLAIKFSNGSTASCPNGSTNSFPGPFVTTAVWTDPSGAQTTLVDATYDGQSFTPGCSTSYSKNRGTTFNSMNTSSMTFIASANVTETAGASAITYQAGTLYLRDGTKYTIDTSGRVTQIEDRNGNLVTLSYGSNTLTVTDPLARTITATTGSTSDSITYRGYSNALRTITVTHTTLQHALEAGQSIETIGNLFPALYANPNSTPQWNPTVVSGISLPDNSSYTFLYDSYGELAVLELPGGGWYNYGYPALGQGVYAVSAPSTYIIVRPLSYRYEYSTSGTINASAEAVFSATYYPNGSFDPNHSSRPGTSEEVDFEDGSGNLLRKERHCFDGDPTSATAIPASPASFSDWSDGLEFENMISDANTTWQTSQNVWTQRACASGEPCWFGSVTADTAPPHDPQVCQNDVTLDSGGPAGIMLDYDSYNNPADIWEYDYGKTPGYAATCPAPPSGYTRHTAIQYATAPYTGSTTHILNLPSQTTVEAGGTVYAEATFAYDQSAIGNESNIVGHDSNYSSGFATRGNATMITQCLSVTSCSGSNALSTLATYDLAGNVLSITDPNGNKTQFAYADSQNTYAHPTTVTNALNEAITLAYDYSTGKPTSSTDLNGVQTISAYNDPLDRLTQTRSAAGLGVETQSNYSYPSTTTTIAYQDQDTTGDKALETKTTTDGLGRAIETDTYESSSQYIAVTATYDALSRVATTSNPSRPGDGLGYATTYSYDPLGRTTQVLASDGQSTTTTTYSANTATTTDPAGNKKEMITDGLGRLTAVVEDPGGLNYTTTYAYDIFDDILTVQQGSETRTFTYDSLGRKIGATNPESGTDSYIYDNNGNLTRHTDARGAGTASYYYYDALNRLTSKQYKDGTPPVTITYDSTTVPYGIGRLASVSNNASTTNYIAYDPLGRVTQSSQVTSAHQTPQTYSFSYAYNLAGVMTSETYPSGRQLTFSYDGANRISQIQGQISGQTTPYLANVAYAPHGAFTQYEYGNTLWRQQTFNSRLQPYQSWDANTNQPNPTNAQTFLALGWNWGTNVNNGILYGLYATHAGPGQTPIEFSESYAYNPAGRITQANDWLFANGQNQTTEFYRYFQYDQYGNMWVPTNDGVPRDSGTPIKQSDYTVSTNQLTSATYDPAGNQTSFGTYTLAFDAESRQKSATEGSQYGGGTVSYFYDGNGLRIESVATNGSDTTTTVFVYDVLGQLVAQYSSGSEVTPDCQTCYLSYDHLGSTRLVTDEIMGLVARHDYLPFGEEVPGNTAGRTSEWDPQDNIIHKFTGKVRDSDTQLDYSNARYFGATLGRFLSPDPGNAGADPTNPETWNAYAYVGNSPLTFTDPTGLAAYTPWDNDDGFGSSCGGYNSSDPLAFWPGDVTDPWGTYCPDDYPVPIIYGAGGGSGGGGRGNTNPPDGGPLPPGSFPGGENLGLPPGMSVPNPLSPQVLLGLEGWDCSTGICVPGFGSDQVWGGPNAAIEAERAWYTHILPCVRSHYGLSGASVGLIAAGQPIAGTKRFVTVGTSRGSSAASILFRKLFDIDLPSAYPTIVGGLGAGSALRISGTTSAGAVLGRAVPIVGYALLAYDIYKIGSCVVDGDWSGLPHETGLPW